MPNAIHAAGTVGLLAVVALVGWLDAYTGREPSFAVFYVIPVVFAGWRMGRAAAIVVALGAGGVWLGADVADRVIADGALLAWNTGTRLAIFAALGWLAARLHSERQGFVEANARLQDLLERESARARTDALTGLANVQGFREHLDRELARSERGGEPFALAFVDLDDFKSINDVHGHAEGDDALRRIAEALKASVRTMDIVARLGGDEFMVLLPGAGPEAAKAVAERVLDAVASVAPRYPSCPLGASIGVVCTRGWPHGGTELIRRADGAMYQAKREGKSRVVVVEEPAERPEDRPQPEAG
ncbi:MAG: GGDEF domain-containing protein [Myxococcota bacterium]